jgi:hypothetical protein
MRAHEDAVGVCHEGRRKSLWVKLGSPEEDVEKSWIGDMEHQLGMKGLDLAARKEVPIVAAVAPVEAGMDREDQYLQVVVDSVLEVHFQFEVAQVSSARMGELPACG